MNSGKDLSNKPLKLLNAMKVGKAQIDGLLSAERSSGLLCSSGSTKQATSGNNAKKVQHFPLINKDGEQGTSNAY